MTGAGGDPSELAGEGPALPGPGAAADSADLARDLLRVAAIPANADVLDAALRLVVALARVTVGGADGVSVSLRRHGQLTTVAASDETVSGMDRDQYATGEGPCVSAATEGHWFHVESLDDERRWPAFIPRARQRGINSIISTPLLTRTRPVGALNIYSVHARAFAAPELELSSLFAAQASDLLVSAAVDVSVEELSRALQDALRGRDVISQARGVLMGRDGVTAGAASSRLRRSARETNTPLRRLAEDIVAATQPPSPGGSAATDDA
jgi:GAF domain-containing protein